MATQSAPHQDRQLLFEDLVETLTELRSGRTANTLAQLLVRKDHDVDLVALVDGGERAVIFHPTAHTLLVYPFDTDGIDESRTETLWQRLGDPTAWVDAYQEDVDWVHPRHRWILEAEQSSWGVRAE